MFLKVVSYAHQSCVYLIIKNNFYIAEMTKLTFQHHYSSLSLVSYDPSEIILMC